MIRSLDIHNFKSLNGCPIPMSRFTCLIGLNGSGKTTFLQAVVFLARKIWSFPIPPTPFFNIFFQLRNQEIIPLAGSGTKPPL